jgi:hypothetical protein
MYEEESKSVVGGKVSQCENIPKWQLHLGLLSARETWPVSIYPPSISKHTLLPFRATVAGSIPQ